MGKRAIIVGVCVFILAGRVAAADQTLMQAIVASDQVQTLEVGVGKSKVLSIQVPVKRASLANPDVVDAVMELSDQFRDIASSYSDESDLPIRAAA